MTEHHIQRKLRQVAEALACTVPLVGNALGHIQDELALTDGYKSTTIGDGGSRSTAELTVVEAAVHARYEMTSRREQLRDDVEALTQIANSLREVALGALRYRTPQALLEASHVTLCSGAGKPGDDVPWVPHSRDPDNGWRDTECRREAVRDGMCGACWKRADRWAREHGYRSMVTVEAADYGYRSAVNQ